MFNKNVFTQNDPIADLIKPMLEAQTKAKMEELKGNQAVLDKNKNNKLDAQDFKILRGEKKAVKEEEEIEESSPFDWKKPREPEVKGGAGVKAGRAYGGAAQKSKPEQDDADDKKKVKEEVEQVEEAGIDPATGRPVDHAKVFKSETDTMAPGTKKYVGRAGGKEVTAKKDIKGNIKFYHRDGIKGPLRPVTKEEVQIDERSLTAGETAERERIVKGMKKGLAGFKARYGDRAKSVMYATATARAKK